MQLFEQLDKEDSIKLLNPELCDFSSKFYFNVLLDEKSGFCGGKDWTKIQKFIRI